MVLRSLMKIENMRTILFVFLATGLLAGSAQNNNLQNYTPSILFGKGDWEYKSFQNLYTGSKSFNTSGGKVDNGVRENYFTSINQFLYGLNDKINVGVDVWVKNVSTSDDSGSRTAVVWIWSKN